MAGGTRFIGMNVWRVEFPLRFAFTHNLASRNRVETLLVALTTSSGRTGYGQALPRAYLTGESMESAFSDLTELWWPAVRELVFPSNANLPQVLAGLFPLYRAADGQRATASYAALDVAVTMACAASTDGAFFPCLPDISGMPLVGVISAAGARKAAWMARLLRWLGFRHFKVKVGRDADADARRLEAVRHATGPHAWLAVDANAAWSRDEAPVRMRELTRWGVVLVEEPIRGDEVVDTDFRELERMAGIPVMADESLCTRSDATAFLARGSPSWWNLRLLKNGGFSGVMALSEMADAHGIKKYGGILVGETSAMAMAAARSFFATRVLCGECGFSRIFLRGDPFRGAPGGFRGYYENPPGSMKKNTVSADEGWMQKHAKLVWQSRG